MESDIVIQSRPPQFTTIKCPQCSALLEFMTPAKSGPERVQVKCHMLSCSRLIVYNLKNNAIDSNASSPTASTSGKKSSYKIGSDAEPLSMEYYEILGLPHTATTAEIKKKYYVLAMQYHPDKNQTPDAEEKFKKISEVYQVLSDPVLRTRYNEFGPGKGSNPEGGFMNPEEFFKQQFGGELFNDIIGELTLAKDFKNVMVRHMGKEGEEETEEEDTDPEKIAKSIEKKKEEAEIRKQARDERVRVLAENLVRKLSLYTEGNGPENEQRFKDAIEDEANELKVQNFGIPLLQSVGYIYSAKANEYLSKDEFLGISTFFQQMRLKGRAINNTFSTVKTAVDVHKTFTQLQEAEKRGMSQEEREKLETEAAKKGINVLWKGSKLEVESVLRNVCDKVLDDPAVEKELLRKRAFGLKIIGDLYQKATYEPHFDLDQSS